MTPDELNRQEQNEELARRQHAERIAQVAGAIYTRQIAANPDANAAQFEIFCDRATDAALVFCRELYGIQAERSRQAAQAGPEEESQD